MSLRTAMKLRMTRVVTACALSAITVVIWYGCANAHLEDEIRDRIFDTQSRVYDLPNICGGLMLAAYGYTHTAI